MDNIFSKGRKPGKGAAIFGTVLMAAGLHLAADTATNTSVKEVSLQRSEKGAKVNEHVTLDIPSSMKLYKVGSNVIRTEDEPKFQDRRIEELEEKQNERLESLEKRINFLEAKISGPESGKDGKK